MQALFPCTIIYCRTPSNCGQLYVLLKKCLGKQFTEPNNVPTFRLVDMYHSFTNAIVQVSIVKQLCEPFQLRVVDVIATVAFVTGINCHHIWQVIHLGPPGNNY